MALVSCIYVFEHIDVHHVAFSVCSNCFSFDMPSPALPFPFKHQHLTLTFPLLFSFSFRTPECTWKSDGQPYTCQIGHYWERKLCACLAKIKAGHYRPVAAARQLHTCLGPAWLSFLFLFILPVAFSSTALSMSGCCLPACSLWSSAVHSNSCLCIMYQRAAVQTLNWW